jgi:hypothetical protein
VSISVSGRSPSPPVSTKASSVASWPAWRRRAASSATIAAAWTLTHFAVFRIATVCLLADPSPALLERLGFREDPCGANLRLVVPNDEGVFQGAVEKDNVRCVHPVQVYVDLKGHPERATEAAERLRAGLPAWRRDG